MIMLKKKSFNNELRNCECEHHLNLPHAQQLQNCLSQRFEDLVESTCCNRTSHLALKYNVGSTRKIPRLLQWNCINGECADCGIEKKLKLSKCDKFKNNNVKIPVMMWTYAPRAGKTKDGKQNTQLELSKLYIPFNTVYEKMIECLQLNRLHVAQYEWRNLIRKIDLTLSNPNNT